MQKRFPASSLLVSLILLSAIGVSLFLSRDYWLNSEKVSLNNYENFLAEKIRLLGYENVDKTAICQAQQKKTAELKLKNQLDYRFHCKFSSIFLKPKPTKEKYILVENLADWLDMESYADSILLISSLDELPANSENNPIIVRTTQAISGRLRQPFYGIVITDYPFDFTDKRIFGTIYSSFSGNEPNRRNHSFRRAVINHIEQKYSTWHYFPNSTHLLHNENNSR